MSKDYSATPLAKKLAIKEGASVVFPGAPKDFAETLGPLPADVTVKRRARGNLDVIVLFATRRKELERRFKPLAEAIQRNGGLWIAYPKKASGVGTDLTFEVVQSVGLEAGLVDNKSCSIDRTWSALRFVYRLEDR